MPYNDVIEWICGLDAVSGRLKKEQVSENGSLSEEVIPVGQFSNRFYEHLKILHDLKLNILL